MKTTNWMQRTLAFLLMLAMLAGMVPAVFATEEDTQGALSLIEDSSVASSYAEEEQTAPEGYATRTGGVTVAANQATIKHSKQQIVGYWVNGGYNGSSNITATDVKRLVERGVTDFYVLVKGTGSTSYTQLDTVIANKGTARVHAWLMCARDNTYIKNNPTCAEYHFRTGQKNAHSSGSYLDSSSSAVNGYVDLSNSAYITYMQGVITNLKNKGVDGIHLDTIRYGANSYGWDGSLQSYMGKEDYNTVAKAACVTFGWKYTTTNGYITYSANGTTATGSTLEALFAANGTAAQKLRTYRTNKIANFVKKMREATGKDLVLSVAMMPEACVNYNGKGTYGQDARALAPYVDYVMPMTYVADYYLEGNDYGYNASNNTMDAEWVARVAEQVARDGCNVVAGIQAYTIADGILNGGHIDGEVSMNTAHALLDVSRRTINKDPSVAGDILGVAVFRTGTAFHSTLKFWTGNSSSSNVSGVDINFYNGSSSTIKKVDIIFTDGVYFDNTRSVTKSGTTTTYTKTVGGTATNTYYYQKVTVTISIAPGAAVTINVPTATSTGAALAVDRNNAYRIAVKPSDGTNWIDGWNVSYAHGGHLECTFNTVVTQAPTCTAAG